MSCSGNPKKKYILVANTAIAKGEKGDKGDPGDAGNLLLPINSSDVVHDGTEQNGELLSDILDSLLYIPVSITSFTTPQKTFELGQVLTSIPLTWSINKTITSQSLSGSFITPPSLLASQRSITLALSNANIDFTIILTVDDGSGEDVDTETLNISFTHGVYYGIAGIPGSYNSSFIQSLTKKLQINRSLEFTLNIGTNQYGFYALPSAYGIPSFTINGFAASMELVATINYTNIYSEIEEYNIYRTEFSGLGITTINAN